MYLSLLVGLLMVCRHKWPEASLVPRPRAGGNGTAGTAMAVPVFEGEKWRHLDSNLRVRYRMASLSGLP